MLKKLGKVLSEKNNIVLGLKKAFQKIKNEFDEHLDTINQNTNEIQANYEFLCQLDSKMDKLSQRVDDIHMYLMNQKLGFEPEKQEFNVQKLTVREQEVVMVLYTNEAGKLTFSDIAKRLGFKDDMVKTYVTSIINKGVPVLKKIEDNKTYLTLDVAFKNYQAKENILKINENLAMQFV